MHKTEIVGSKQLSDDSLAFTIRCCGNPKTDSVLTIYGVAKMSADQLMQDVHKHHDRVAQKCQGMETGKKLLAAFVGKTKIHEAI